MAEIQYRDAHRVLEVIRAATKEYRLLTYQSVSAEIGRDPKNNSRAVAQVCDLLDAAAEYAQVPALALVMVRNNDGRINPKAWIRNAPQGLREAIVDRSLSHQFTDADFKAIAKALRDLAPRGNIKAWEHVRSVYPIQHLLTTLATKSLGATVDAIDDIGTDEPNHDMFVGLRYRRDPQVRLAVRDRAQGRCEYCGELGFEMPDGHNYIETHHIIALANDGADRVSNVIGLCPNHHREAHFGIDRLGLERKFMEILGRAARVAY